MSIPIDFTNIGKNKPQGAQNVIPGTINDDTNVKKPMPHCKACTDFKTWMELTAHPRRVKIMFIKVVINIILLN